MYTYTLLIYNLIESIYLHIIFKILFYYFIGLCQILKRPKLGPTKFIIYRDY